MPNSFRALGLSPVPHELGVESHALGQHLGGGVERSKVQGQPVLTKIEEKEEVRDQ